MTSSSTSSPKKLVENDYDDALSDLIESFALMPQIIDKYETRFLGVQQSELYKPAGMVIPKLPMYHPYHPFKYTNNGDDILQVPLAIILPNTDMVPLPLLEHVTKSGIDPPLTPYFIAQTLPYSPETEVICRYQYALFQEAECEMKGNQSIWTQSIIYEKKNMIAQLPATQIKIYESEKNKVSHTILCGDSMKLDTLDNLRGKGIWSLVLGSHSGAVGDDGLFTEISQAFIGFTYFIPDNDAYKDFLSLVRDKTPKEVLVNIPALIDDVDAIKNLPVPTGDGNISNKP